MEKKKDILDMFGDFCWEVGVNTCQSILDLTPQILKNKNHRILFLSSTFLGIFPIIKFQIEPKGWFIFGFNYFIISGIYRTIAKLQNRKVNKSLNSTFNNKVSVINSVDTEKFITRVNEISELFKSNIKKVQAKEYENKLELIKSVIKIFHKNNIFKTSLQPIKTFVLRSDIPLDSLIKKRSELSHILDTNIIAINQGRSKKIILIKTCKKNINTAEKMSDKIQFLLNEFGFNILGVKESERESMKVFTIRTTSEFLKLNKKCDYLASRLGLDKKKVYMTENKGIIQLKISSESRTYPFLDYIDLPYVKKKTKKMEVPTVLGMDLESGKIFIQDLAKMPHCLIMGGTSSGKSCFVNVLIQSAMYLRRNTSFLLLDFKFVELNIYEDFKNVHFVNNYKNAAETIDKLNEEMNRRLKLFAKLRVKTLQGYNKKYSPLPYLIVVVDEAADIKLEADNKKLADIVNTKFNQIINKARASGAIIVYAMQRADGEQIGTGIRSQLMTKIGFGTSSEKEKQFIEIDNLTGLEQGEFRWKKGGEQYLVKGLFIDDEKSSTNKIYRRLEKKNTNVQEVEEKVVKLRKESD